MSIHKNHFVAKCGAVYRTVVLAEHYDALQEENQALIKQIDELNAQIAESLDKTETPAIDSKSFPINACIWERESTSEWVLELSGSLNGVSFNIRHTQPLSTPLEDVAALDNFSS